MKWQTLQSLNKVLLVEQSDPEVIRFFSCSTQLSMKFFQLINVKMPTIDDDEIFSQN